MMITEPQNIEITDLDSTALVQRAKAIVGALVSIDSQSHKSNRPIIDWIAAYLERFDIRYKIYPAPDAPEEKAGLWAHIGPEIEGGVVLSGHSDVVPVKGQAWTYPAFAVTEENGRLYGRGTCDMKGYLAIVLAAVPVFRAANLQMPVQIAISWDEELGCLGAPDLIHMAQADFPKAAMAFIGEPTEWQVVTGQKGIMGFETIIHGYEVHSSRVNEGVPAVMIAAELIEWHRHAMLENERCAGESPFTPPFTTLHVGKIEGGIASNITAKYCRFLSDVRTIPEDDAAEWSARYQEKLTETEARMKLNHAESYIEFRETSRTPGLRPENNGTAEALARRITGDNGDHVVAYGTEAGQFQDAGYSAIVCGPGSIIQAHQPDEYLNVEELHKGAAFMQGLARELTR